MKNTVILLFALCLFAFQSCIVPKKVVYLKDMEPNKVYNTALVPPLRVQKNDRLSIQVTSKNPELAVPFNPDGGVYNVSREGAVSNVPVTGSNINKGYLVDQEGNIEFPVLGTLNVEGLTLDGVRDMMRDRMVNEKLISDAVIKIELMNLKITMMGAVSSVGVLDVPDSRITLIEAITRSGGISANAKTNKVAVIREEAGGRKMYLNDIEKMDIFNSPTYYLQQNDIVYVEPRSAEMTPRESQTIMYFGLLTGVATMVLTLLNLMRN
ncbi:polysaccharide biosynthesis/export family protein [Sphingobacterium bambusae]|uniref:Polysaccharide biosynthesis/export family protein n=1 Tax=Sphingobacterium bambusae TaxID=662858 RepID=A0ABW6BBD6_9SPHI|nr:polysaccharide biosynthesis/export family protein [Sphingobacterium bambusae]WPL46991.1 polysaccharide biosynthesis/export family protein [Sphingobacterium bambusae]